jgi:hypothetical protein
MTVAPPKRRARKASAARSTPAITVHASTPGVSDILTAIVGIVQGAGAHLDADLVLTEDQGHLFLATGSGLPGRRFIDLPQAVLVPIDSLTWDETEPSIRLAEPADALSPVQRDLLSLHVELWNALDKLTGFRQTHPKVAAAECPALEAAIQSIRPSFRGARSVDDLLRSRTFGFREADGSRSSVIMPILELADHHPHASPYRVLEGHLGSTYSRVDDRGSVFVRYGPSRDALDLACQYGYVESATTFVISAPVSLDLDGFGTVTVGRTLDRRSPPQWTADETGVFVDYLRLDVAVGLFDTLFAPVKAYLVSRGATSAEARDRARRACDTVLHVNRTLRAELHETALQSNHVGAHILDDAVAHQWQVLDTVESRG